MKYVNIGAHKTGTMSLTKLMTDLGYRSFPSREWYVSKKYRDNVQNGNYRQIIKSLTMNYNFFADSPYNINSIYKSFRDVKFMLTIRDPREWFNSFLRWADKITFVNSRESDVYMGYGAKITKDNRKKVIDRYNKRNDDIVDYFKGDIFMLDTGTRDDIKILRLSNFLGIKIDHKYPHINRTR